MEAQRIPTGQCVCELVAASDKKVLGVTVADIPEDDDNQWVEATCVGAHGSLGGLVDKHCLINLASDSLTKAPVAVQPDPAKPTIFIEAVGKVDFVTKRNRPATAGR